MSHKKTSTEKSEKGKPLPTVEALDACLDSSDVAITSSEVCEAVKSVFGIDIGLAAVLHADYADLVYPRAAIEKYLKQDSTRTDGSEIRTMIKLLFGINLVGIAELYKDRIALYSKNQWIVKNDQALFLVRTGKKDIDVKILSTPYFQKQTNLSEMPLSLQQALAPLGYSYNEKEQTLDYIDPDGQPVSGQFKVQTMKTIANIVHTEYDGL
ncbi:hypothetical protein [Planomicrobium sp. CPCC 101110]|uniref:hypothetical protein n=1 Tax=Planomicrobium sp. CPCC 101110 TaxID=2599619 RepID=UPI0011B3F1E0|nr:hypothetical protein [Planomicrobium sp. CPCC 101110]TWT25902.1 hypothetical protein FQV30_08905 [Planomicrobium sp. CPCC 101110]